MLPTFWLMTCTPISRCLRSSFTILIATKIKITVHIKALFAIASNHVLDHFRHNLRFCELRATHGTLKIICPFEILLFIFHTLLVRMDFSGRFENELEAGGGTVNVVTEIYEAKISAQSQTGVLDGDVVNHEDYGNVHSAQHV